MDLRSGTSIWQTQAHEAAEYASASGSLQCEVLLIGAGITGALLGYALARRGVSCILVDKRTPGLGSTAASTGLLQYEIDTPLVELIGRTGRERAVHAYRRGLAAIDEIEALADELGREECQFVRRNSLYYASNSQDARRLRDEYECRSAHGLPVQWLDAGTLGRLTSIRATGAIHSTVAGELNPLRFTRRLLERGVDLGLRIFGRTRVERVVPGESSATAHSSRHASDDFCIEAKSIVYCTGYEVHELLGRNPGNLQSTYALASEPLTVRDGWPENCIFWETDRPYFYGRMTADGRAIMGGEDTPGPDDHDAPELLAQKARRLQAKWNALFPEIDFRPACVWAGTFAETRDGLAYIGPIGPRSFAALGYGGNGITFATIAARLLADQLLGNPNPDGAVFAFDR